MFRKKKHYTTDMTNDKKVKILEKSLDEKEKENDALRAIVAELENRLEDGSVDEIADVQKKYIEAAKAVRKQEREYKKLIHEFTIMKKRYMREMDKATNMIPKER